MNFSDKQCNDDSCTAFILYSDKKSSEIDDSKS